MLVHRRVTPGINYKFAGTHLYITVERNTVRVKCLVEEHNTPTKARTWTARSGVERTNYLATAPPAYLWPQEILQAEWENRAQWLINSKIHELIPWSTCTEPRTATQSSSLTIFQQISVGGGEIGRQAQRPFTYESISRRVKQEIGGPSGGSRPWA